LIGYSGLFRQRWKRRNLIVEGGKALTVKRLVEMKKREEVGMQGYWLILF
jgi:hypothetical protein